MEFSFCFLFSTLVLSQATASQPVKADSVSLDELTVVAAHEDEVYDATGLGAVEQHLRDELFSNDLISIEDLSVWTTASMFPPRSAPWPKLRRRIELPARE